MASDANKDKRAITLDEEADEHMELVHRPAPPPARTPAPLPAVTPRSTRRRMRRPLTQAEVARLEIVERHQLESARILEAIHALLRDKGVL